MAKDLTVTVTGPTGDLGVAVVEALEASNRVKRVVGLARRPFDPKDRGWKKTRYREGDVQDAAGVRDAVKGTDVVVHLAFSLLGAGSVEKTRAINVEGSRNVFEAAVDAGAERICYASSVAAYGFHADSPDWLDEDVPARGTETHFYSQQKAEVEQVLAQIMLRRPKTSAYVFRPCVVAGPRAVSLISEIPYVRASDQLPASLRRLVRSVPGLRPIIPDPGLRFQLVHEDDVAQAFLAGALGKGPPGAYNLAGKGTIRMADVARALGWYSVPIPRTAVSATAEFVARAPALPEVASWIEAARRPVLMRTDRAVKELGWSPKHTAKQTLRATVAAFRATEPGAPS
jgi:nucleoside-diphosphate-sugar epimerase